MSVLVPARPDIFTFPFTSSFCDGAAVPIPTLPSSNTVTRLVLAAFFSSKFLVALVVPVLDFTSNVALGVVVFIPTFPCWRWHSLW